MKQNVIPLGRAWEDAVTEGVRQHLRRFFEGHPYREHTWSRGPAVRDLPELRIMEFAPGFRTSLWVYATVGASAAHADPGLEFVLVAPAQDARHIELATMMAWYHLKEKLGLGHTLPIGEPWLPGSLCTSMLVSLPYPFGPELERGKLPGGDVRVLWLLPITEAEKQYKNRLGVEALEQQFDAVSLEYWRPDRASVVPADAR
jgi:hypothetical protein